MRKTIKFISQPNPQELGRQSYIKETKGGAFGMSEVQHVHISESKGYFPISYLVPGQFAATNLVPMNCWIQYAVYWISLSDPFTTNPNHILDSGTLHTGLYLSSPVGGGLSFRRVDITPINPPSLGSWNVLIVNGI